MNEFWKNVLMLVIAFLFGAGGLALLNMAQERWKIRFGRKAEQEDRSWQQQNRPKT